MAENEPKKETVRITLPTRPAVGEGGAPAPVKKETVRINLPSRPTLGSASSAGTDAPKKESSKLSNLAKPPVLPPKPMAPPPPGALVRPPGGASPSATAPLRPAPPTSVPGGAPRPPAPAGGPPRPPGAPGAPGGAPRPPGANITRPLAPPPRPGGPPAPPRPPSASTADTLVSATADTVIPEAPRPPVGEDAAATIVSPTPKKDTVRIEVPKPRPPGGQIPGSPAATGKLPPQATGKLPPQPQATAKLQSQPLRPQPAEVRTLSAPATAAVAESAAEEPMLTYASIGVLVFSVLVLLFQVLNYIALSAN